MYGICMYFILKTVAPQGECHIQYATSLSIFKRGQVMHYKIFLVSVFSEVKKIIFVLTVRLSSDNFSSLETYCN
jgi:hypothetical protein